MTGMAEGDSVRILGCGDATETLGQRLWHESRSIRARELDSLFRAKRLSRASTQRVSVYLALRRAIALTEMLPGDQIDEREIADAFRCSRSTVRAAVRRLRHDGLISERQCGVPVVGLFRQSELDDAQFLREALECAAVRIAARTMTPEHLLSLTLIVDREADSLLAGDLIRSQLLDDEFHRALCELSGQAVWCITHGAGVQLTRIRCLGMSLSASDAIARTARHTRIIAALYACDPERSADLLRDDLQADVTSMQELRLRRPSYFLNH